MLPSFKHLSYIPAKIPLPRRSPGTDVAQNSTLILEQPTKIIMIARTLVASTSKTLFNAAARPVAVSALASASRRAGYHSKVVDHYENPRNVGSMNKNDLDVGTGLVGAPACGDVMKLQIKVDDKVSRLLRCTLATAHCIAGRHLRRALQDFWLRFGNCLILIHDGKGQGHDFG